MDRPPSLLDPPIFLAQRKFPKASNFKIKTSTPTDVRLKTLGPGSKSIVPIKSPVV